MPGPDAGWPEDKLTYRWARKGSRPRAIHDQRTQSTYLFGAVCPERGAGAALVLPACNSEAMQLHLDEIATKVTPGGHAIVLLDHARGGSGIKEMLLGTLSVAMPPGLTARCFPGRWISGVFAHLQARDADGLVITGSEKDAVSWVRCFAAVDIGYRVVIVRDAICSSSDKGHEAL